MGLDVPVDLESLTGAESDRLRVCENLISRGLPTFFEVGLALQEIRDGRLFRADHATFRDYCRRRWGYGTSRAYQLMGGARVVRDLRERLPVSTNVDLPKTEAQVRPLIGLEPQDQRRAWLDAVQAAAGRRPTARDVGAAVARLGRTAPSVQGVLWPDFGEDLASTSSRPDVGDAAEAVRRRGPTPRRSHRPTTHPARQLTLFREPGGRRGRRGPEPAGRPARAPLRREIRSGGGDPQALDHDLELYRTVVSPQIRRLRAAVRRRCPPEDGPGSSPLARALIRGFGHLDPRRWVPCPGCVASPTVSRERCGRCRGVGYLVGPYVSAHRS